jgi:GT2 family glycosyltransferase/SAM-dependent methyltransferase
MTPKFSVVIPTYNHLEDCLKPCCKSIREMTARDDIEVLVVANGCKDGTREYVESLGRPFKLVWFTEPLGYTKATNEGIKVAQGEYIILLNNDTVILKHWWDGGPEVEKDTWLNMLVQPFEQDPKMGVTGPMKAYSPEARRDFMIFFCVMIKKELFKELGLLDEIFSPGFGEDTDFSIKAELAGYKIKQVPTDAHSFAKPNFMIGSFPIFHKGEGTFADWPGGNELLMKNREILSTRYALPKTKPTKDLKSVKLNLGAGDQKLDGYLSVDLHHPSADVKLDIRNLQGIADESVDEILSIHVIEHISPFEIGDMFREWARVLKPGAKAVIETPDVLSMFRRFESSDKGERYNILNAVYAVGTLGQVNFTPHLFGWYDEILTEHLQQAGFFRIQCFKGVFPHWGDNLRVEAEKIGVYPDGFFSTENALIYRDLIERVPDGGAIAEIGVWKGRSLTFIADLIRQKKLSVIAVDDFAGTVDEGDEYLVKSAKKSNIEEEFKQNMQKAGIAEQILICRNNSVEAAAKIKNATLDLVFIDGDHKYENCKADIMAWNPKLKSSGIMSGHDYAPYWGVPKAVDEIFGASNIDVKYNVWNTKLRTQPNFQLPQTKSRIFDCFIFFNELELLELRFNELNHIVDKFVIVESRYSHTRQPKPLYFEENKQRFTKFLPKVEHVIIDEFPTATVSPTDEAWFL